MNEFNKIMKLWNDKMMKKWWKNDEKMMKKWWKNDKMIKLWNCEIVKLCIYEFMKLQNMNLELWIYLFCMKWMQTSLTLMSSPNQMNAVINEWMDEWMNL